MIGIKDQEWQGSGSRPSPGPKSGSSPGSGLRQGSPIDRCNSEIVSCVGEKSIEGAR